MCSDGQLEALLDRLKKEDPNINCPEGKKVTKICLNQACANALRCSGFNCKSCGRDVHIGCFSPLLNDITEHINIKTWKPIVRTNKHENPEKKAENQQFLIKFKVYFEQCLIQDKAYNNNMIKAYALFQGKCTKSIKKKKDRILMKYRQKFINKRILMIFSYF